MDWQERDLLEFNFKQLIIFSSFFSDHYKMYILLMLQV